MATKEISPRFALAVAIVVFLGEDPHAAIIDPDFTTVADRGADAGSAFHP